MKYIVAVDGSAESEIAVDRAIEYARGMDADLEIVHAARRDVSEEGGEHVIESPERAEDDGRQVLERIATDWIGDRYDRVETTLLRGEAGVVVPEYANEVGADAVFVGHRGLSTEHEAMVGSVAKKLIDRSQMPVMVVGGGE